jgi:hypothetical protein
MPFRVRNIKTCKPGEAFGFLSIACANFPIADRSKPFNEAMRSGNERLRRVEAASA